ncbi:dethiobiotin synthase [Moraxella sp. ZY210820]|uniref:dethiobiotin synthase n=1 Tax=unclassified Moraxella TaxID=2685852 RepID=UPI00272F6C17|nr:dethiobiotin synthase [Moraxella sp. ZY210820]WLF85116.1 dethiobiotin synthase [Moraxella sp. ZY210820]
MQGSYFITGIDTDIGKTYFTGKLAKTLYENGQSVITQKLIQTGCHQYADDVLTHRQMMGIDLLDCDKTGLTMPCVLSYPCSPHLASRIDNKVIDLDNIYQTTCQLEKMFDIVLIEGAGGLFVPINNELFLIDYIKIRQYPVILVTSGRLGSINHTILSINAILKQGLTLYAVAYNHFDDHQDKLIANDTQNFLKSYLKQHCPRAQWWEF